MFNGECQARPDDDGELLICGDEANRDRHGRKANIERCHSTDTAKKIPPAGD